MDGKQAGFAALTAGAALAITGLVLYFRSKGRLGFGRARARTVSQTDAAGMKLTHYRDDRMPIQQRVGIIQDLVWKSIQDPRMRKIALQVTKNCPARDGECEARAVFDFVRKNVRYTGDVGDVKMGRHGPVEGVDLFQSAFRTLEFGGGDCLPVSTLVLRNDGLFVPLSELKPGVMIMGHEGWTMVEDVWLTGEKPILSFELRNGCELRCSPDHRVFRVRDGRTEEVKAEDIRPGDDLLTPDSILPTGSSNDTFGLSSEDYHWLLGTFVADGWCESYRFAISGRDGHPKEEQKQRVQALMETIEIPTRWHERYIAVNDPTLAEHFALCGSHAPNKRLPSLQFANVDDVRAVIEGLKADGGRGGRDGSTFVHSTTSSTLALQLRALYRMIGQSVHIRRVDRHGGLGRHPIYRVTVRQSTDEYKSSRSATRRWARVRAVRLDEPELCADLTVRDHKFWLPESDTIVHNCDDHTILNSTLLALNGINPRMRVTAPRGGPWQHIYAVAGLPKNGPAKWVALDTTLPQGGLGTEAPFGKKRDFVA